MFEIKLKGDWSYRLYVGDIRRQLTIFYNEYLYISNKASCLQYCNHKKKKKKKKKDPNYTNNSIKPRPCINNGTKVL